MKILCLSELQFVNNFGEARKIQNIINIYIFFYTGNIHFCYESISTFCFITLFRYHFISFFHCFLCSIEDIHLNLIRFNFNLT